MQSSFQPIMLKRFCRSLLILNLFLLAPLLAGANEYSQWRSHSSMPGLKYRTKRDSDVKKMVWVEFRNGYNKTLNFAFRITTAGEQPGNYVDRIGGLKPGKIEESWNSISNPNASQITVWISKVRFGDDDSGPYEKLE